MVLGVIGTIAVATPTQAEIVNLSCDPQGAAARSGSRQDYSFDLGASTVSLDTARLGHLTFPLTVTPNELSWTETYDVPQFPSGHFYAFNRLDRNSGTLHSATGPTNPPTTEYIDYRCTKSQRLL